jgi:hypothetical protein
MLSARTSDSGAYSPPSPGARPGDDHDPDPAARKAHEPDWRAQPAPSHPTAVDVDPGADPPTTPWLPQPDSQRPPGERRGSVTRGRCSPAVPTMPRDQVAADPLAQPGVAFLGRAAVDETPVTASRPPPRPRRGSQTPARSAPWAASERVNVSAAHARRGRGSEARRRRGDAAALGLGSTRRLRRGRDDRISSGASVSRTPNYAPPSARKEHCRGKAIRGLASVGEY